MATIDFRDLFAGAGKRPGMYGIDDRYRSAVAYVEGCDAATGYELLEGMSEWLDGKIYDREGRGSVAWWGLVVTRRFPHLGSGKWSFTPEQEALLTNDLWAVLDEFLADRPHTFNVARAPSD